MKRFVLIPVLYLLLAGALVYVGDYVSLRFRIPNNRDQFGSVIVQRSYAVTMKDKKTEYMFDPPQTQACVNSLFPHYGDSPCWYLANHQKQRIEVGAPSNPVF